MSYFTATVLAMFLAGGAIAWRYGGPPERFIGAMLAGWLGIDCAYHLIFGPSEFTWIDPLHLTIDTAQLAATTWVALRANRMWPLWVSAASLAIMSGHLAIWIHPVGRNQAYWALISLPQYIQLGALALGVVAHVRRRARLGQDYRSWRKAPKPVPASGQAE